MKMGRRDHPPPHPLDRRTDVAVIKLEKPPTSLVTARLGDSNKIEVGEWVLAVGARAAWSSPGAAAGLSPGEVIVEIDRKPVISAEQAASALRGERMGGHLLRLRGPAGSRFVSIGN